MGVQDEACLGEAAGLVVVHVVVVVVSAARAIDPSDVIATLKAAATQAAATLLKVMTLPLSAPVARSARPIWCADTQSPLSARHASRETTAEPITDIVGG